MKSANAGALLNYARQYYEAGNIVFTAKPQFSDPINFMYFQSLELALKAYLKAHNKNRTGHDIGKIYKECQSLGMKIEQDGRFGLGNIVSMLEKANKNMAFRYCSPESTWEPDLNWTREIVGQLLDVVAKLVEPVKSSTSGRVAKLKIIIGKPVNK